MSRPVAGVDIPVARAILEYNMKRSVVISLARVRKRGEEGLISGTPMVSSSYTSKLDYIPPNVNLSSQIVRPISSIMMKCANKSESLQRALDLDLEYVQLQHMCLWDYACNFFMLGNWKSALDCFSILKDESNWSRAVYT
jgi:hypothetical protein